MDAIDAGDVDRAVAAYPGPVLPASDAPGVADLRLEVHAMLRALVLSADRLSVLRAWVAGAGRDDRAAWRSLARAREAGAAAVAPAWARSRGRDRGFGAGVDRAPARSGRCGGAVRVVGTAPGGQNLPAPVPSGPRVGESDRCHNHTPPSVGIARAGGA